MEFTKAVSLPAGIEAVWDFLWDIERMATCLPGCRGAQVLEAGKRYRVEVAQRVGPFQLKIPLEITVRACEPPHHLVAVATGQDRRVGTNVSVELDLHLADRGADATELAFSARVTVLGKLATLGHGMINRKAHQVMEEFTDNLSAHFAPGAPREAV